METKKQPVLIGIDNKSGLELFRRCKRIICDFDEQIITVFYEEFLKRTNESTENIASDKCFILKNIKKGEKINNTNLPNYSPDLKDGKISLKSNLSVIENDFLGYDNYNELEIDDCLEQMPIDAKNGYIITTINNQ